jgi:FkbM family methyltransferase
MPNSARTLYRQARDFYGRAVGILPDLKVSPHNFKLLTLGSDYGGWTFVDRDSLRNSTIVSCGLGEDASFDVEFAAHYDGRVIILDPTPRAIAHFDQILKRVGQPAKTRYAEGGAQPPDAYNLSKLNAQSLTLVPKALWNEAKPLRFYAPKNPSYVSHSIVNYQHDHKTDTAFIEVQAITFDQLLAQFGLASVPLLKIDIEGAETEVLHDLMAKKIHPEQILVEYDELTTPSKLSKNRVESAHKALLANGYCLIHRTQPNNFLYVNFV